MKYQVLSLCVLAGLSYSQLAMAQEGSKVSYEEMQKTGPNTLEARGAVEAQAKVTAVNKKTREVTFKTESGEDVTVKATDEVRNFDQIKKGDMLKVKYMESLVLELKKKGEATNSMIKSTDITRSAPGEKPGGVIVDHVSATGTITKIDKKNQSVEVKGPNRTVSLHIKDKSILDELKKGDKVEATYTEALALSIETVKR